MGLPKSASDRARARLGSCEAALACLSGRAGGRHCCAAGCMGELEQSAPREREKEKLPSRPEIAIRFRFKTFACLAANFLVQRILARAAFGAIPVAIDDG